MPAEVVSDLFDEPKRLLEDLCAHVVVASRGGEPIATAMTYESDGVASLQWVGTVPGAPHRAGRPRHHDRDKPRFRTRRVLVHAPGITHG